MAAIVLLFVAGLLLGAAGGMLFARRRVASASGRGSGARAWQVLAVPVVDGPLPEAALATAARLGRASGGRVVVLAVVLVPRTLSLDVEAAPGIDTALTRLEAAEHFLRGRGVSGQGEIVRVREVGDLLLRACAEVGVEAVVIEAGGVSRSSAELLQTFVEERGPRRFDVIVTHAPNGAATPSDATT